MSYDAERISKDPRFIEYLRGVSEGMQAEVEEAFSETAEPSLTKLTRALGRITALLGAELAGMHVRIDDLEAALKEQASRKSE